MEEAPAVVSGDQLRFVLQTLLNDAYGLFEEAAEYFTPEDEDQGKTDDALLTDALSLCIDEQVPAFLLWLLLSEHRAVPQGEETDLLEKAAAAFAPSPPKPARSTAKKQKGDKLSASARRPRGRRRSPFLHFPLARVGFVSNHA